VSRKSRVNLARTEGLPAWTSARPPMDRYPLTLDQVDFRSRRAIGLSLFGLAYLGFGAFGLGAPSLVMIGMGLSALVMQGWVIVRAVLRARRRRRLERQVDAPGAPRDWSVEMSFQLEPYLWGSVAFVLALWGLLTFSLSAALSPGLEVGAHVVLAAWLGTTLFVLHRRSSAGRPFVSYYDAPFHPGETVRAGVGVSAGGAVFRSAQYVLRCVEGDGKRLLVLHQQFPVPRPERLHPSVDSVVEVEFELADDAWGSLRRAGAARRWELVVRGDTTHGDFVGCFLVPIYERTSAPE
jgi:hypothetical protein